MNTHGLLLNFDGEIITKSEPTNGKANGDGLASEFRLGDDYEGAKILGDVETFLRRFLVMTDYQFVATASPDGNYVLLKQLAAIDESSGRYVILHEGARRVQTITCNVQHRTVESFVQEARKRISRLSLPAGTYVEFSGTAEAQAQSRRDLFGNSLLAALGILLLLYVIMRNYRNLLLVLANLPFAFVGGVLAASIAGGSLSLGSLVGFVTLSE